MTLAIGLPFDVKYKALSHLLLISDDLKHKHLEFASQRGSHSLTSVKRKGGPPVYSTTDPSVSVLKLSGDNSGDLVFSRTKASSKAGRSIWLY